MYIKIARLIEEQIHSDSLKTGDKIPSVRSAQKLYNVSLNTIKQAYLELESRSLIEARPKNGYYVSNSSQRKLDLPTVARIKASSKEQSPQDLVDKVFGAIANKDVTQFALGIPGRNFLPVWSSYSGATGSSRLYCTGEGAVVAVGSITPLYFSYDYGVSWSMGNIVSNLTYSSAVAASVNSEVLFAIAQTLYKTSLTVWF